MGINLRIIDDVIGRSLEPSRNMLRAAAKAAEEAAPTVGKLTGDDRRLPAVLPVVTSKPTQDAAYVSNWLLEASQAKGSPLPTALQGFILPTPRCH